MFNPSTSTSSSDSSTSSTSSDSPPSLLSHSPSSPSSSSPPPPPSLPPSSTNLITPHPDDHPIHPLIRPPPPPSPPLPPLSSDSFHPTYLHHSHHHHHHHHHHHRSSTRSNSINQVFLPISHHLQLQAGPSQPLLEDEDEDDEEEEAESSSNAPSYAPRSSLLLDDYDERGFGSSAESDVSSALLDEPAETTRMLNSKNAHLASQHHHSTHRSPFLDQTPSSTSSPPNSPLPHPSPPLYWSQATTVPITRQQMAGEPDDLLTDSASSSGLAHLSDPHHSLLIDQPGPRSDYNHQSNQYFHSHHYRTSALPRKSNNHLSAHYTNPSQSSLSGFGSATPRSAGSVTSADSSRRSRRGWFSTRRQKRKNSIHALSASSLSSSSLHSPSFHDLKQSGAKQPLLPSNDHQNQYSTSPSRRSHSRLRRSLRSLPTFGLTKFFSRRWSLISLLPCRKPWTWLMALIFFGCFATGLTTFLIHFLDTDKEPLPWRTYCQEQREFPHEFADSLAPVNVFVGVFSMDAAYERRHLIRSTYARHSRPIDPTTGRPAHNVQLKFVLGKPRIQHARRVALEMETYNDLVILDIEENMNRGKTYAYFRWASENATVPFYYHQPDRFPPSPPSASIPSDSVHRLESTNQLHKVSVGFRKADFVVKADDDAFIVLSELERHLRVAPRTKTYWGYLIRNLFMGGECYALSSDLVDYVATSSSVLNHLTGAEDKKVAKWMRIHPNATTINWVSERCWIYDHPKAGTTYAHGFLFPDEVSRVRAEGRRGLTAAELETRGNEWAQTYSTVIKWKQRYVAPRSQMTMEEEVEALVEGGGKFSRSDWKVPQEPAKLIPIDKVVFEADDARLPRPSQPSFTSKGTTPPVSDHGSFTPAVSDHYQESPLKFGRPPSELLASLPAYEDMPDSEFKQAIARSTDQITNSEPFKAQASSTDSLVTPGGTTRTIGKGKLNLVELPDTPQQPRLISPPTLRYDPDDLRLRELRYEGRRHGGTVVVHYLKRSEWFLETELVLLGKARTWDSGLEALAFGVYEGTETTKKPTSIELSREPGTGTGLETVEGGGVMFGGARMYGSPLIDKDGTIKEGEVAKAQDQPLNDITKTVAGGAGWVRGKPRLRVSDPEHGPDFGQPIDEPAPKTHDNTPISQPEEPISNYHEPDSKSDEVSSEMVEISPELEQVPPILEEFQLGQTKDVSVADESVELGAAVTPNHVTDESGMSAAEIMAVHRQLRLPEDQTTGGSRLRVKHDVKDSA